MSSDANSAYDESDFDTKSAIIRPTGVPKKKDLYDNEYDEACAKL